jgi:AcrR family transcriptional regulator
MTETKRLRRPAGGGYARGDETRRRIIDAAVEVFGERGFEAASTREIAARAGVNAPALQYYFENKEGVYRACVEFFAEESLAVFEPVMAQAQAALDRGADVDTLIDAFIAMLEAMADKLLSAPASQARRLFFVREQTGNEPPIGTQILQERLRSPLNRVGVALVSAICGTSADDPRTRVRMMSLYGQLMFFHIAPRSALNVLGWREIDAQKGELIKETVRTQARALLQMWHAESAAGTERRHR